MRNCKASNRRLPSPLFRVSVGTTFREAGPAGVQRAVNHDSIDGRGVHEAGVGRTSAAKVTVAADGHGAEQGHGGVHRAGGGLGCCHPSCGQLWHRGGAQDKGWRKCGQCGRCPR